MNQKQEMNQEQTIPVENEKGLKDITTKRIVIYLGITFVLTYAVEIFLIAPMLGSADVNQAMVAQTLISAVMLIPTMAVILTRVITKEGFKGRELMIALNLKGNKRYYALAWFGFALLITLGAVLYFLLFPKQFDGQLGYVMAMYEANAQAAGVEVDVTITQLQQTMVLQTLMGVFLSPFVNVMNCFGEEWGWRGYLLPKMLKKFKVVPTLLISGVIWGLWHMPLTIMGHNYGNGYPGYPVTGILAMCVFCTVLGIILSYVTIKTRSCIPAIMGHGMMNGFATIGIYFTSLDDPYNVFLGPAPTGLIGGMGFLVLAGVLLYLLHKEEKEKGRISL